MSGETFAKIYEIVKRIPEGIEIREDMTVDLKRYIVDISALTS